VVLVLGLTGANAAGKGEVASYLRDRGFAVHSLSDVIRDEAAARGLPPEREHLIRIGNLLRERGGPGVLAERILPRLGERDAVDSIRKAPLELRFQRSVSRCRPGDPTTLQQFRQREVQENSSDPAAQQLAETFARADRIVENVAGLGELHDQLDRLLVQLDAEKHWPRARDC
jgi:dephospho-CoA kinase